MTKRLSSLEALSILQEDLACLGKCMKMHGLCAEEAPSRAIGQKDAQHDIFQQEGDDGQSRRKFQSRKLNQAHLDEDEGSAHDPTEVAKACAESDFLHISVNFCRGCVRSDKSSTRKVKLHCGIALRFIIKANH